MVQESLQHVPRDKRPTLDDLEGYTESRYPPDTDFSMYRRELSFWLHDNRRDEEDRQGKQGATPLAGHGPSDVNEARHGYKPPADFDLLKAAEIAKTTPSH